MYPLSEGLYAARNQWYVAAWSSQVGREPMERWILNEPVALFRKEDGTAVALAGRCPHRHFPLGKSRVVGDDIECGYHGMKFGPDGRCVSIPTQTVIPAACHIKSYPLVEKWKWMWIWMGDPALADASQIPDHAEIGLEDPLRQVDGDVYHAVPGRYMLMHDNLMDLSHFYSLHRTTIAADGMAHAAEVSTSGDNWLLSERKLTEAPSAPFFEPFFGYSGKVDRVITMRTLVPNIHLGMDVSVKAASDTEDAGAHLGSFWIYHAVTPATLNTAHYFFALGRDFEIDNQEFGAQMLAALGTTLDEDMLATREVERMLASLDHVPQEILIKSDAHCVKGRRLFEKQIREEMQQD